ncbi:unnamed protein product [Malus baccata var. baccata]
MTASTASLTLHSLSPKTLAFYTPKPASIYLYQAASSALTLGYASPDLKLFVDNLPFSVDSVQLAAILESAVNMTRRSRGFGFVTMSSVQEAEFAARQLNGYVKLDGRALRVNYGPLPPRTEVSSFRGARGPRGGGGGYDSNNRLYVGNLSWGVDNLALENLFSEQGKVLEAKVVYDRDNGRSMGFSFVTYDTADQMNSVIESLDGVNDKIMLPCATVGFMSVIGVFLTFACRWTIAEKNVLRVLRFIFRMSWPS